MHAVLSLTCGVAYWSILAWDKLGILTPRALLFLFGHLVIMTLFILVHFHEKIFLSNALLCIIATEIKKTLTLALKSFEKGTNCHKPQMIQDKDFYSSTAFFERPAIQECSNLTLSLLSPKSSALNVFFIFFLMFQEYNQG